MIPVIIAAAMCITYIIAWVIITDRLDPPYRGRHDPFATPADIADPGEAADRYIEQLTGLSDFPPVTAGEDDPAIDDTGQIPHAHGTWGKPAPELAAELAARYLT